MTFWKKKDDEIEGPTGSYSSTTPGATTTQREFSNTVSPDRQSDRQFDRQSAAATESAESKSALCQPDDIIAQRHEKVRSALGPGTVIQGKLSFDTPVRIDGKLSGEVFSSRALIVGKSGQIDAKVEVASLIVYGSVKGTVIVSERVEIYEGGSVDGEIRSPALMVESGARLNGTCDMGARSKVLSASDSERGQKNSSTTVISDPNISMQQPVYEQKKEENLGQTGQEVRVP